MSGSCGPRNGTAAAGVELLRRATDPAEALRCPGPRIIRMSRGPGLCLPACRIASPRNASLPPALDSCVGLIAADRPHAAPAFA